MNSKKEILIDAFIRHELGMELTMSNSSYDELLKQVMSYYPQFNIFEYLPVPEDSETCEHRSGIITLYKYSPENNDIRQYWHKYDNKIAMPKYDGSSGVAYYTNGKLSHIASMSDKDTGVIQTDKLRSFVPAEVSTNISFIRFELLVDVRHYENARGKANGLMNSKYLQDEVDQLVTLVAFDVVDIDSNHVPYKSWNLNPIKNDNRYVFIPSPTVDKIILCEERGIAYMEDYDFKFCIDGIVFSEDEEYDYSWAYKYDYLSVAKTIIKELQWWYTDGEGYSCTLRIDPVELDNKTIRNVSTNGVRNIIDKGLGVGAEIEVAFSGMTIPKVVGVITPVEPDLTIDGHVYTEDDIYGGVFKNPNPEDPKRLETREGWMKDEYKHRAYILEYLEWFLLSFLNIARWNYESKRINDFSTIKDEVLEAIESLDYDRLKQLILDNYGMSYLQSCELELVIIPTVQVINKYLKYD